MMSVAQGLLLLLLSPPLRSRSLADVDFSVVAEKGISQGSADNMVPKALGPPCRAPGPARTPSAEASACLDAGFIGTTQTRPTMYVACIACIERASVHRVGIASFVSAQHAGQTAS